MHANHTMKNKTTFQLDNILSNKRYYPKDYIRQVVQEFQRRRKARNIKDFVKNFKKNL